MAVLGLRPHTYWTAVVVLDGDAEAPRVRRRLPLVFAEGEERNVYHRAAETPAAAPLVAQVAAATQCRAEAGLAALAADLAAEGATLIEAVVPASAARRADGLAEIVASHTRMHANEGHFYRDVLARACAARRLAVRQPVERELPALLADRLGLTPSGLAGRLQAMGEALGPPWSEDYRLAAQAGWWALAGGDD